MALANDQEPLHSDCESSVSDPSSRQSPPITNGLIRLFPGEESHDVIKTGFLNNLGRMAPHITDLAIHKNRFHSLTWQAKLQSFQIFMKAIGKKSGGNANVKFAWYSAKRDEISKILEYGFGHPDLSGNDGLHGCGVYLSPYHHPIESVKNAVIDEDGRKYLILCRVILGKVEMVQPGSRQSHPSSEEFDSAVDDLKSPKKYIFWSTNMNTHILPELILSFRASSSSSLRGFLGVQDRLKKPTSPWIPFTALISELSKSLPPTAINLLSKYYRDYRDRKIARPELVQFIREIAGDKLLISVLKTSRNKNAVAFSNTQRTSERGSRNRLRQHRKAD